METAWLCRYGHQDVHKIRGIDRPLTALERALFARAIYEHWKAEFEPRKDGRPEEEGP